MILPPTGQQPAFYNGSFGSFVLSSFAAATHLRTTQHSSVERFERLGDSCWQEIFWFGHCSLNSITSSGVATEYIVGQP